VKLQTEKINDSISQHICRADISRI